MPAPSLRRHARRTLLLVPLLVAPFLAGCVLRRTEWVSACEVYPDPPVPSAASALAWYERAVANGRNADTLLLRIRFAEDTAPPADYAWVRLADSAGTRVYWRHDNVRTEPMLRVPLPGPGAYQLSVGRIGYARADGQLRVRPGLALHVVATLARQTLMFDGCSMLRVKRPKPWWRLW